MGTTILMSCVKDLKVTLNDEWKLLEVSAKPAAAHLNRTDSSATFTLADNEHLKGNYGFIIFNRHFFGPRDCQ